MLSPRSTVSLVFVSSLTACASAAIPDGGTDAGSDTVTDLGAPDVDPNATVCMGNTPPPTACCCAGDSLGNVQCTAGGQPTCNSSYGLYFGDDCRCLASRDTPCCLPHVRVDAGAGD